MRTRWSRFLQGALGCVVLGVVTLFMLSGCKPNARKRAEWQAYLDQEVEQAELRIQDYSYERQDEAIALVDAALSNPRFAKHRHVFFPHKIALLLSLERGEEAADLVLDAWRTSPELANPVFGHICDYYLQRNRFADLRAWCEALRALGTVLPASRHGALAGWCLQASLGLNASQQAREDIAKLIALNKPEVGAGMLERALGRVIDAGRHAEVKALLDELDKRGMEDDAYREVVASLALRCVLLARDWPALLPALNAGIPVLRDEQLLGTLQTIGKALKGSRDFRLLEQVCKQTLFNATGKTKAVGYAARVWVEVGMAQNKKVLADRLNVLLNVEVSPVLIGDLFERFFYEVIDDEDVVRNLLAVGDRLIAVCKQESTVNMVKVKVLDGTFVLKDYDRAVQMLEAGIPGRDKIWHDMSLPKVKAHRAMAQNKPREAVACFRAFMNAWQASDQEEESHPTTGISHSREWILGRNAIRIARLLDGIPDKEEANKAREEARDYFIKALKLAENDPRALQALKKEIQPLGLDIPLP